MPMRGLGTLLEGGAVLTADQIAQEVFDVGTRSSVSRRVQLFQLQKVLRHHDISHSPNTQIKSVEQGIAAACKALAKFVTEVISKSDDGAERRNANPLSVSTYNRISKLLSEAQDALSRMSEEYMPLSIREIIQTYGEEEALERLKQLIRQAHQERGSAFLTKVWNRIPFGLKRNMRAQVVEFLIETLLQENNLESAQILLDNERTLERMLYGNGDSMNKAWSKLAYAAAGHGKGMIMTRAVRQIEDFAQREEIADLIKKDMPPISEIEFHTFVYEGYKFLADLLVTKPGLARDLMNLIPPSPRNSDSTFESFLRKYMQTASQGTPPVPAPLFPRLRGD